MPYAICSGTGWAYAWKLLGPAQGSSGLASPLALNALWPTTSALPICLLEMQSPGPPYTV